MKLSSLPLLATAALLASSTTAAPTSDLANSGSLKPTYPYNHRIQKPPLGITNNLSNSQKSTVELDTNELPHQDLHTAYCESHPTDTRCFILKESKKRSDGTIENGTTEEVIVVVDSKNDTQTKKSNNNNTTQTTKKLHRRSKNANILTAFYCATHIEDQRCPGWYRWTDWIIGGGEE
jgi:hypothetical protein